MTLYPTGKKREKGNQKPLGQIEFMGWREEQNLRKKMGDTEKTGDRI